MKLFYFTGTGNCLEIAKRFDAELFSIPQVLKQEQTEFEAETIGIIFPCYTFGAPPIVKEFIEKVSLNAKYVFTIITYGNMLGNTAEWFTKFARKNNIRIDYCTGLLMVDNYLPSFDITKELAKDKNIEQQFIDIHGAIMKQEHIIARINPVMKVLANATHTVFEKFSSPASDEKFIVDGDICTRCGICAQVCPRDNITIDDKVNYHGTCEFCLACINLCPQQAIYLEKEANRSARFKNQDVTLKEIITSNQ